MSNALSGTNAQTALGHRGTISDAWETAIRTKGGGDMLRLLEVL
jgi:hypothetical protein